MNNQDNLVEGIVVKAYGGYFYVHDGVSTRECTLRGRLRYLRQQVMVGDRVLMAPGQDRGGIVQEALPRRSALLRPAVANVDQAVIVFSLRDPEPNPGLLERFLITAALNGITPVICFNKVDLTKEDQVELVTRYRENYNVVVTSAKTGAGLSFLRETLNGKISVFAGPSGVGKSTLLNSIIPGLKQKTGEVSARLKSGKHTTRHIELILLADGGFVADTPGFSSMDLPDIKPEDLAGLFPGIGDYQTNCYFTGCLHYKEPGCSIKEAVEEGNISKGRYLQYLEFLEQLMDRRRH
ncbi:ribosome small subunit-dependent GTPase A [Pelotomaculum propionicicum]|uniref:ribosome small subunit-dependent GTPase A n=1 Tax=Pelotomaculum propionicicum TaxID=258475 RepID=UPI003B7D28FD